jgi:hypothetical protein
MLETFAVVADEKHLGEKLRQRYAALAQRLALYLPFVPGKQDAFWRNLAEEMRSG